jgi:hypothetical protein
MLAPLVATSRANMGCSLASEKCQQEKRKTVNGEDILFAMTSLGFENYGEALKIYLARYREVSFATAAKYCRSVLTPHCRTLLPAVNINVLDRLEPKANQALPTTTLATPFLETLWILPLRVRLILPAILSRIKQSTRSALLLAFVLALVLASSRLSSTNLAITLST